MMIHPVVLAGGSGARLWPSSRQAYPKQFAPLLGEETLFQATLRRLAHPDIAAPLVMTNAGFRFLATEQCAAVGLADARVVIEPALRETAPAVLAAAMMIAGTGPEADPEAVMLVLPSDHLIGDREAFHAALATGAEAAAAGRLVALGVAPDRAETGYGYLETEAGAAPGTAASVRRFTEKPEAATAEGFVASGRHLWNAGIFLFRVRDILEAFEMHAPDLLAPCREAVAAGRADLDFFRLDADSFGRARAVSLDYAVMEKAGDIAAVPLAGGWSDLGSWRAVWEAAERDADGVATAGTATAIDCASSYLRSDDANLRLVGVGLENTVAVAMRDAVLVAGMGASQGVKGAVAALRDQGVAQATEYPRFHRPWGWYETLGAGTRFQVKRIMVHPGAALSLQSHMHRAEHWVVVAGTARITLGEEDRLISENESVYIPLGTAHRLANPGRVAMYLIEVQTGAYLGEDDIERFEDIYGRGCSGGATGKEAG